MNHEKRLYKHFFLNRGESKSKDEMFTGQSGEHQGTDGWPALLVQRPKSVQLNKETHSIVGLMNKDTSLKTSFGLGGVITRDF